MAMNTVAAKLEALDIPIVYISMGSPAQARELSKKLGLVGTIYVDPDAGGTVAELKSGGDEAAGESSGTDGQDGTYSRQRAQAYALFSLLRSERTTRHEKTVELATALIGKGIEDDEPDSRGAWPGDIFQVSWIANPSHFTASTSVVVWSGVGSLNQFESGVGTMLNLIEPLLRVRWSSC